MNELRGLWRGKRICSNEHNGEWVEGFLCPMRYSGFNVCGGIDYYIMANLIGTGNQQIRVDSSTLGECTGLRDEKGKPIFEGDICTVATANIADDEYGVIKYDCNEAVFVVDFCTYTINFCDNIYISAVEVIGNIQDSPELLGRECDDNARD